MLQTEIIKKRRLAYKNANDAVKDLYSSEHLDDRFNDLISKYETSRELKHVVGDTILGFHKSSELPELLQKEAGVSADDAQQIVSDLSEFLTPVIAREKGEINPNHVELKELQDTFTPVPKITQADNSNIPDQQAPTETEEPAQTPTPVEHTPVQAMRTMEGDMNRIHGYGAYRAQFPEESHEAEHTEEIIRSASQEDLLTQKPKLATMPTYEEGEGG